jgi:transposase
MTLSDEAAMTGQDGRVTDEQPGRPKRRTFTKAYKARILAAFDALPEGSPERGALLRSERLYHSHIEHWRKQAEKGTLAATTGKPKKDAGSEELAAVSSGGSSFGEHFGEHFSRRSIAQYTPRSVIK